MPYTVRLHRVLRAPPERVYRAFLDADAMAKWLPPNGFTGKVHQMDANVGGRYKMSFTNLSTGQSHSFGGEYLELVPNKPSRQFFPNRGEIGVRGRDIVIRNGLIMRAVWDTLIVAPPLVITKPEIDALLSIVVRSLDELHHDLRREGLA